MFSEWLDKHQLIEVLKMKGGCPFPSSSDRKAWEQIPENFKDQIRALAEEYRDQPYPMTLASQYMAYVRDGSRQAWEEPYFLRRRKLAAAVLAYCLDQQAEDLDTIMDGIWCICEESSWVISAHNVNPHPGAPAPKDYPLPDIRNPYIDLFSAQTAMILSLTTRLVGADLDRLAPVLNQRIQSELERRILVPFETRDDFWWMGFIRKDLCNWTPWIVSNVLITAALMLSPGPRLASLTARAVRMLDRWLDVVPADGGCDEGPSYWNMAGGAFLDCLELLYWMTDGALDLRDQEKARNILLFPAKVMLENGWFVNFADCDARPKVNGERLRKAGEWFGVPELTEASLALHTTLADQINDVPHFWRALNLLFHPAAPCDASAKAERDTWFPDLQLRITEQDGLILAAKGGHNGESHNHNDVGSFMLYVDGEPVIVDAGNMVYTARTFSERRYELWNVRSLYHNLPIIAGQEQPAGSRYRATEAEPLAHGLATQLKEAWPESAGILSYRRSLSLEDSCLRLSDDICLKDSQPVEWILMLRHQPEIAGQSITAGPVAMSLPEGITAECEELPVQDPRMARCFPGSLWRLKLRSDAAAEHQLNLSIVRSQQYGQ